MAYSPNKSYDFYSKVASMNYGQIIAFNKWVNGRTISSAEARKIKSEAIAQRNALRGRARTYSHR